VKGPGRDGHLQFVDLLAEAQVGLELDRLIGLGHAVGRHVGPHLGLELGHQLRHECRIDRHGGGDRAQALPAHVRRGRPEGREHRGQLGYQYPRGADRPGDLGREERAPAAVAQDGVLAGVEPERGQPSPHRLDHPGQRQFAYPPRRLLGSEVQLRTKALAGRAGGLGIKGEVAAEEPVRVDVAQHDQSVGHRGLVTAALVAGRSGNGTGRARSDPEHAPGVDPAQRSAAGADRLRRPRGRARSRRPSSRPACGEPAHRCR
jgi:hypothetical protein